tara:strand:- start:6395 stop:6661 length:267 start_codon:yes stop_codon:yes gene_type:complete
LRGERGTVRAQVIPFDGYFRIGSNIQNRLVAKNDLSATVHERFYFLINKNTITDLENFIGFRDAGSHNIFDECNDANVLRGLCVHIGN